MRQIPTHPPNHPFRIYKNTVSGGLVISWSVGINKLKTLDNAFLTPDMNLKWLFITTMIVLRFSKYYKNDYIIPILFSIIDFIHICTRRKRVFLLQPWTIRFVLYVSFQLWHPKIRERNTSVLQRVLLVLRMKRFWKKKCLKIQCKYQSINLDPERSKECIDFGMMCSLYFVFFSFL